MTNEELINKIKGAKLHPTATAYVKHVVTNRNDVPISCDYLDINSIEVDSEGSLFIRVTQKESFRS